MMDKHPKRLRDLNSVGQRALSTLSCSFGTRVSGPFDFRVAYLDLVK